MPTRIYWAGWTRLPVVTSKIKYDRNNRPRKSSTNLSDRFTDWYGSASSTNETPSAVESSPATEELRPSAGIPRAIQGTDHSPENPCVDTVRLTGRNPPSKLGFGQSPSMLRCVVLP